VPIREVKTATEAAIRARAHAIACAKSATIAWADLRSPIDGKPLDAPIREVVLAPEKGVTDRGSDEEALAALVFDRATDKSADGARLPLRPRPPKIARTRAGDVLAVEIESEAFGTTAVAFGPVLRLDAPALTSTLALQGVFAPRHRSFYTSRATEVRLALDDRRGALRPGDRIEARAPGFGAIDRPIGASESPPYDPGDVSGRFLVAHGLATGLPLLSIGLSLLNVTPACVTLCGASDQPLSVDASDLDRVVRRSASDLRASNVTFRTLEISTIALAFSSVLIPSARRGVLSRSEVIEDAMIIGESMLVGLSTPLWLQRRIGRARPISFHAELGPTLTGRDAVGAPFMALNTTVVFSAFSSAATLMILEESGPGWIFPAALALGGLAGLSAYWEVHAGVVFPSDVPLAIVEGLLAGAGTALWHHIFWRGWPGETERGDLPLRLKNLDLGPSLRLEGFAGVSLRGEFE
jgi:hypothetical protein